MDFCKYHILGWEGGEVKEQTDLRRFTNYLHNFMNKVKWTYVNNITMNFQMFKLVLEKVEEPEIKLPISAGSLKKQEFQKNIYFCFIDYAKAFDCVDHINCGKFWKRWEYQTPWPASWETCMQVGEQQLELDMDKQAGSK